MQALWIRGEFDLLFIVSGRDHDNGLEHRLAVRPRHRAYYESLDDDLILSGPYLNDQGDPIGSMIIIRRKSQADAEAFAHADPFVTEGVFASLTVSRWDWFMKRPEGLRSD
jgi:uncharacterized protein